MRFLGSVKKRKGLEAGGQGLTSVPQAGLELLILLPEEACAAIPCPWSFATTEGGWDMT